MRKSQWCGGYVNRVIGEVTINNTTNVTNVTNVHSHQHTPRRNRRWHNGKGAVCRHKKPALLSFYQSCGLLDQHKVMRMSDEQFLKGTADVMRYTSHDVARNVRDIGHGVAKIGHCSVELGKRACGMVFGAISSILG